MRRAEWHGHNLVYIYMLDANVIYNLFLWKQEADAMRKRIELKEKELLELEGKLDARERVSLFQSSIF